MPWPHRSPSLRNPEDRIADTLCRERGLVAGIANRILIAFGCAAMLRAYGAKLAATWANAMAEPPLRPLDVEAPGALEAVFDRISREMRAAGFRHPFHRPRPARGPAGPGHRVLGRRFRPSRACTPLVLPATAQARTPAQWRVDIAEVGRVVAFLVSPAASRMTGDTIYVDGRLHNVA
ncbi:SDR family oxidoreductase [Dankookia sp. P2]|uniref:SDR family oxidoreductase n=1 Tax=Dankookia sp. P2 TaxID=3423955 RepID=UPI003D673584